MGVDKNNGSKQTAEKKTKTRSKAKSPEKISQDESAMSAPDSFPIVGIGASAGGLAAFEAFFAGMPPEKETGMAYVLVQHLDPGHKSMLAELIRRCTRKDVFEVEDGIKVEPDCVYVIPPNFDMALIGGELRLKPPTVPRGHRLPIDFFFHSLAEEQQQRAAGIVLAGTGMDGTLGGRAIKAAGGVVIAQNPDSTEFSGMPQSVIAAGVADYKLPPAEMVACLMDHFASLGKPHRGAVKTLHTKDDTLKKICALLHIHSGHDFSQYKPGTVYRRMERRMALHQLATPEEYLLVLQQNSEEVQALFQDMMIGVTSFFRDRDAFAALETKAIPLIFDAKPEGGLIRVWVPGCSTGEEAYSLGILIQEYMDTREHNYKIQIFATDLDRQAIAKARAGLYPANVLADLAPERLAKFFHEVENGNSYRIAKRIRDCVIFSEQDLIQDPPFSKLDMISCRNLMIYLGADLQKKIIPLFHYALVDRGILFLGTSESAGEFDDLFDVLDRKAKIYQCIGTSIGKRHASLGRVLPTAAPFDKTVGVAATMQAPSRKISLRDLTEQEILQHYGAAALLVNGQGEILYIHGRAGRYLEVVAGEPSINNVTKMARGDLKRDLTVALCRAVATKEEVSCSGIKIEADNNHLTVNLTIRPVPPQNDILPEIPLYLVILAEGEADESEFGLKLALQDAGETLGDEADNDPRIVAMRRALQAKEEYLSATNEELETANEELCSTNEEMQSMNEEMQSTNEELETSKEELQSINEELTTVNAELQTKVADLSRVNNDMNNLLAGTGIATIFVDCQLRILRFTPAATQIINLILSDIGRPLGHIVSNVINYENLLQDTQSVLDELIPKEMEVQTRERRMYNLRILPYRTLDNLIEGAVITFSDITEIKRAQAVLQTTESRYRPLFEAAKYGILLLGADSGEITAVNPALAEMLGYPVGDLIGKLIWQTEAFAAFFSGQKAFTDWRDEKSMVVFDVHVRLATGEDLLVKINKEQYVGDLIGTIQCEVRNAAEQSS
jgi:two-component system CheB/CheR fusion protein